jgi:hypothetical protein
MTKQQSEDVANFLYDRDICADFYHAGQSATDREMVQEAWQRGDIKVVCATIAYVEYIYIYIYYVVVVVVVVAVIVSTCVCSKWSLWHPGANASACIYLSIYIYLYNIVINIS